MGRFFVRGLCMFGVYDAEGIVRRIDVSRRYRGFWGRRLDTRHGSVVRLFIRSKPLRPRGRSPPGNTAKNFADFRNPTFKEWTTLIENFGGQISKPTHSSISPERRFRLLTGRGPIANIKKYGTDMSKKKGGRNRKVRRKWPTSHGIYGRSIQSTQYIIGWG